MQFHAISGNFEELAKKLGGVLWKKNMKQVRKVDESWWKLDEIDENCMKLHEIARRWNFYAVYLAGEKEGDYNEWCNFYMG